MITDDLEPIERASRDELRALQLERLRWIARARLRQRAALPRQGSTPHGVHPADLKSLADLAKFPFTAKKDLRDNYPFGMFAVPREQVVRIHASVGHDRQADRRRLHRARTSTPGPTVMARSIRAAGGRAGDIVHVAYGYGLFTGGLGAHYGAERLGCTVIPMSGGQTEKQVQLIADFKPDIIMVTPSLHAGDRRGDGAAGRWIRATCSLEIGIFGAEPWTEAMRAGDRERKLGIDAVDIYGLSEVMGPGVASECIETKDGPTVWEDHFYPEIIDPDTGEVLPDGERGRAGVHVADQGSAAGDPLPHARPDAAAAADRAQHAAHGARSPAARDDMLIIRGVNVFPTQIEELILKQGPNCEPHYQLDSHAAGRTSTRLTVHVRDGSPSSRAAAAIARRAAAQSCEQRIKTYDRRVGERGQRRRCRGDRALAGRQGQARR